VALPGSGADAEAAVLALAAGVAAAGEAGGGALARCAAVTGGTALPDARAALDRELAQLLVRMQARAALRASCFCDCAGLLSAKQMVSFAYRNPAMPWSGACVAGGAGGVAGERAAGGRAAAGRAGRGGGGRARG